MVDGLVRRHIDGVVISIALAASAGGCAVIPPEPMTSVPHTATDAAEASCSAVLAEIVEVEDNTNDDRVVVAAFETTVGGIRTVQAHIGADGYRGQFWPSAKPEEPAVLCYLDVGGSSGAQITRIVGGYFVGPATSGWQAIQSGPPEAITVPW